MRKKGPAVDMGFAKAELVWFNITSIEENVNSIVKTSGVVFEKEIKKEPHKFIADSIKKGKEEESILEHSSIFVKISRMNNGLFSGVDDVTEETPFISLRDRIEEYKAQDLLFLSLRNREGGQIPIYREGTDYPDCFILHGNVRDYKCIADLTNRNSILYFLKPYAQKIINHLTSKEPLAKEDHNSFYKVEEETPLFMRMLSKEEVISLCKKHPKIYTPYLTFQFEIFSSRVISQQLMRHRTLSPLQRSARRTVGGDIFVLTEAEREHLFERTDIIDLRCVDNCRDYYTELVKKGVLREVARKFLNFGDSTRYYMTGRLKDWRAFIFKRMELKEKAQEEALLLTSQIKKAIDETIRRIFEEDFNY